MISALALALVLSGSPRDAGKEDPAIIAIRSVVQSVDDAIKSDKSVRRVDYDIVSSDPAHPEFKVVTRKPDEDRDVTFTAAIYARGCSKLRVVVVFYTRSGDWASQVEYSFRADGSLAFSFTRHVTFLGLPENTPSDAGPAFLEVRRYFDAHGQMIRELQKEGWENVTYKGDLSGAYLYFPARADMPTILSTAALPVLPGCVGSKGQ